MTEKSTLESRLNQLGQSQAQIETVGVKKFIDDASPSKGFRFSYVYHQVIRAIGSGQLEELPLAEREKRAGDAMDLVDAYLSDDYQKIPADFTPPGIDKHMPKEHSGNEREQLIKKVYEALLRLNQNAHALITHDTNTAQRGMRFVVEFGNLYSSFLHGMREDVETYGQTRRLKDALDRVSVYVKNRQSETGDR